MTKDDVNMMLDCGKNPRDKAIMAMLASTGMRISELSNLNFENLNLEENEIKDEMVNIVKKGWNIRLVFSKGHDGNVDVKLQSVINLNDFNIDGWGELMIEHQLNNSISQGQAFFVARKQLFIQFFDSFRRVDSLMNVLDLCADTLIQIHKYLYDNKQQLEADFGEKEQEQNTRKIGF